LLCNDNKPDELDLYLQDELGRFLIHIYIFSVCTRSVTGMKNGYICHYPGRLEGYYLDYSIVDIF